MIWAFVCCCVALLLFRCSCHLPLWHQRRCRSNVQHIKVSGFNTMRFYTFFTSSSSSSSKSMLIFTTHVESLIADDLEMYYAYSLFYT